MQLSVERSLIFSPLDGSPVAGGVAPAGAELLLLLLLLWLLLLLLLWLLLLLARTAPMRLFSLTDFSPDDPVNFEFELISNSY